MRNLAWRRFLAGFLVSIAVAGCGGGSEGTAAVSTGPLPPTGTPTPTGTPITTVGTITAFGSIYVNGVRYDTNHAVITVDDEPGAEQDLRIGYVVWVHGSVDDDGENGIADEIEYDEQLEGPIDSIDVANGTIIVLGQTVAVDNGTVFDDDISPQSLEGLSPGDFVEVSGFVDADGIIAATYIESEDDNEFEIQGFVTNLDLFALTFNINGLTVDYSQATLEGFPDGIISDGDFVEVEGSAISTNDELIADQVELKDDLFDDDGPCVDDDADSDSDGDSDDDCDDDFDGNFEIEGFITRFNNATDFDVAGHPVTTTDATIYENGTADDLALNVKVEVEGDLNADGVLVASEVSFRRVGNIRMEATVDDVDTENMIITVLGIPVRVDSMTQLEDDLDDNDDSLTLDEISVGEFLEVRGGTDPENSDGVLASRVERDDAEDEVELRGPVDVDSVLQPMFTILGVTIETNADTEFEADDDDDLTADEFFGLLQPGMTVEAEGIENPDNVIVADEVEFEEGD